MTTTEVKKRPHVYIADDCLDARDLDFKLPPGIARCFACEGNGKYVQQFIEGRLTGKCDWCNGFGFRYEKDGRGSPVTESVLNQIAVASGHEFRRFDIYGIDWKSPARS